MVKKAPRRTAERILEVTLELFNRFGEPNVSTTLISAELGISPGNLYYHYPAKEELINSLFDRYEHGLNELLNASDGVREYRLGASKPLYANSMPASAPCRWMESVTSAKAGISSSLHRLPSKYGERSLL